MTLGYNLFQFFIAFSIKFLYVIVYDEGVFNVATKVLYRIYIGVATKWCTMGLYVMFIACAIGFAGSLAHDSVADDESGAFLFLVCKDESSAYLFRVVSVDVEYIPTPSTILHLGIFIHYRITLGRELYLVGIVEHDKVVQVKQARNATCAL